MKPPPPMLPAWGCTTASANPVATAASTAFPPECITVTPALEANSCTLATMACAACVGRIGPATAAGVRQATISDSVNKLRRDRIDSGGLDLFANRPLRLDQRARGSQIQNSLKSALWNATDLRLRGELRSPRLGSGKHAPPAPSRPVRRHVCQVVVALHTRRYRRAPASPGCSRSAV